MPLAEIIDIALTARPATISFEAANPRHAHEWSLFERIKLPDGKIIIPGVIESKSNFIEHPELIAQRIARYADLVGCDNVIAGSDCGFGLGRSDRCRSRRCMGQIVDDGRGREAGDETILGRLRRLSQSFQNVSCIPWTRGRNCGLRRISVQLVAQSCTDRSNKDRLAGHDENCGTQSSNPLPSRGSLRTIGSVVPARSTLPLRRYSGRAARSGPPRPPALV